MEDETRKKIEKWAVIVLAVVLLVGNFVYFKYCRGRDNDLLRKRDRQTEQPAASESAAVSDDTPDADTLRDAFGE